MTSSGIGYEASPPVPQFYIWIGTALIMAFLLSGSLYLAFPGAHYSTSTALVYVKYCAFFPVIAIFAYFSISYGTATTTVVFLFLWIAALLLGLMFGTPPMRIALYAIPAGAILIPQALHAKMPIIMRWLLLAMATGVLFEYFVTGGFLVFADMGFRASSIFINPNNLAIVAVLACVYAFSIGRGPVPILFLAIGAFIVAASASKTGMILYSLMIMYLVWTWRPTALIVAVTVIASVAAAVLALGLIRAPWLSIYLRLLQIADFIGNMPNPIFPQLEVTGSYVDNVYLQTWNEVGLPALLVYVAILFYLAIRDRLRSPFWVLFAAAGFTENIIYLWPVGYVFWMCVGSRPPYRKCESTAER